MLFRFLLLLIFAAVAQPAIAQSPLVALPRGVVIEKVESAADPAQSYALYLPAAYDPAKKWPLIYAFDPDGRGRIPVAKYKDVAEKYGYILAGSNNSRNFSVSESNKGAAAMWNDSHERLSIDPARIYVTGFSGGARMAGHIALNCATCQIAGVIAHGAGYPGGPHPKDKSSPAYYLAVGDADFNWPEVMAVRREREDLGLPTRTTVYPGPHQWCPSEIFDDAIAWMQLRAMQSGRTPRDAAFIDSRYAVEIQRASQKDPFAELEAYRSLTLDFDGLKDVSEPTRKLASLKASKELKAAYKKEDEAITQQRELTGEIGGNLAALGASSSPEDRVGKLKVVEDDLRNLKDESAHAKQEDRRLILQRAFAQVTVNAVERGQAALESHDYDRALTYINLIVEVDGDAWPRLLQAEVYSAMGKKKDAMKSLHDAVKAGLSNPKVLEEDKDLQALKGDPEFMQLIADLQRSATPK